jgi:hypothetical protein
MLQLEQRKNEQVIGSARTRELGYFESERPFASLEIDTPCCASNFNGCGEIDEEVPKHTCANKDREEPRHDDR